MSSTTPPPPATPGSARQRSTSRTRTGRIPSRPTTPLRPSSRTSLRASQTAILRPTGDDPADGAPSATLIPSPLDALEPQFAELSDSMADLEANMLHLHLLHESLGRFSESFASFLYGLNMNAFCVDFPEAPIPESFKRDAERVPILASSGGHAGGPHDADATFLTTDTSFVDHPPVSSKFSTPAPSTRGGGARRGSAIPPPSTGTTRGRGRGIPRASRGTGRGVGTGRGRGVR